MRTQTNNTAIKLTSVSKRYTIHHEKPTLVEYLIKGRNEEFWALKDINLKIKKGEKVGIIGPNGSGKTTLLKIIAGITSPTSGSIETYGKIVSLIDLEAGFHPDLTGVDNVYLNGMLLGIRKKEISNVLKSIISFADIGQFIDAPLFTYSEGMKLRLGFSIAIYADPDILILDEGVGAGDINFRTKSSFKIRDFISRGKTVIIVTHWLDFIKKNCEKILLIDHGKINKIGKSEVIDNYIQKQTNDH